MTSQIKKQPIVQIIDQDFQAGFEEAQESYYAEVAANLQCQIPGYFAWVPFSNLGVLQ